MTLDSRQAERGKIREELSSKTSQEICRIYSNLATYRTRNKDSITIREEVAGEILDERRRRKELIELSTLTLQVMHARLEQNKGDKSDDMTLDERLISEILFERNPIPPEVGDPLSE